MIRALFVRNFRHQWRLLFALGLGLALVEGLLVKISARIETGPGLRFFLEQLLPPDVREAMSSQLALLSFAGAVGFGFQHPLVLVAAIAFVIGAATIPAGERESGFLDLLLARPVPRSRYLAAVVLLVVLGAVVLPSAQLAGAAAGLALVEASGEIPWIRYASSAAGLTTLLLAVGGYSLLIAADAQRRGLATARAVGLTLAAFWLDVTADMWEPLRALRWLSPFAYFRPVPAAVIPHTPLENPLVLLAVFTACVAAAFYRFGRRDL